MFSYLHDFLLYCLVPNFKLIVAVLFGAAHLVSPVHAQVTGSGRPFSLCYVGEGCGVGPQKFQKFLKIKSNCCLGLSVVLKLGTSSEKCFPF